MKELRSEFYSGFELARLEAIHLLYYQEALVDFELYIAYRREISRIRYSATRRLERQPQPAFHMSS
jgi:hypothetical protein